ncbi:MAG: DEAD/DEAH box helicase family protein, partial [Chloroflexi bacterium]|nr:DEAD/DEAH box helicase family protein [Chloroflexota bacterium]
GDEPRPVLVLANTHRACNEVVLKLHQRHADLRPYVVRLGPSRSGMEPEVRQHVLADRLDVAVLRNVDLARDGPRTLMGLVREGQAMLREARVFVGTLAAANRPELRGLQFSTVVVDETGQATEPAALQALRHTVRGYRGRLVLVGDHRQLPPVVPDEVDASPPASTPHAAGPDLRISLFERLAERWPDTVLTLADQYRMCGPICELVSETFYGGRLRPATAAVADHRLTHLFAEIGADLAASPFVARAFDPARPVVLIDTSRDAAARGSTGAVGPAVDGDNPREAELIADLIAAFLAPLAAPAASRAACELGVISPYRRQNNRIRQELRDRLGNLADQVRVDTVDRFQGGERELIVLSLVASNPERAIGSLHADWRRMNVAISRARAKLIVVGDRATFTSPSSPAEEPAKERYRRLFELIDRQAAAGTARILRPPPQRR